MARRRGLEEVVENATPRTRRGPPAGSPTGRGVVAESPTVYAVSDLPAQCRSLQASMTRSVIDASDFFR